ncbi:MAG: GTPase HflX [Candidatus Geothermincolia bacterium]
MEDNRERAVLVGLQLGRTTSEEAEESLKELAALADTAGAEVVETFLQKRDMPDKATLVGKGKLDELALAVKDDGPDLVIFDTELTPSQQRNLERRLEAKVIDRTALILDIFALHAHSQEGKEQVEMAQMQYMLSRLTGKGVELSRLGGGIGTRGPGETKLEVDRRRIRNRIQTLHRELQRLSKVRQSKRKRRVKLAIPSVSLVGYTNAGKSSLLNALTGSDALVEDQLFSTLDTTSRRVLLRNRQIVVSDTVGFINKLPHQLVEAFKSTLEEVLEADLILHVVDAASSAMDAKIEAVEAVLEEIGAEEMPRLRVFNKIDLLPGPDLIRLRKRFRDSAFCSARTGEGLDDLRGKLAQALVESRQMLLFIPYSRGDLLALLQRQGELLETDSADTGMYLTARVPPSLVHVLAPFRVKGKPEDAEV